MALIIQTRKTTKRTANANNTHFDSTKILNTVKRVFLNKKITASLNKKLAEKKTCKLNTLDNSIKNVKAYFCVETENYNTYKKL